MAFILVVILVVFAVVISPTAPPSRHRRKSKGVFASLLEGQARTERKNGSHRGVMSSSSRVGARGGKRRR